MWDKCLPVYQRFVWFPSLYQLIASRDKVMKVELVLEFTRPEELKNIDSITWTWFPYGKGDYSDLSSRTVFDRLDKREVNLMWIRRKCEFRRSLASFESRSRSAWDMFLLVCHSTKRTVSLSWGLETIFREKRRAKSAVFKWDPGQIKKANQLNQK